MAFSCLPIHPNPPGRRDFDGQLLKIGHTSRAFAGCGCPREDVALRWPRKHCGALRDTAQRDCARPAPPSARQLPGAGGRRPTMASERGFAGRAARTSQVAPRGLRRSRRADFAGRAARTSPGGVCGFTFARSASGEEGERPTCVRRAARMRSRKLNCRRVAAGYFGAAPSRRWRRL
jgi:hypothetical protein